MCVRYGKMVRPWASAPMPLASFSSFGTLTAMSFFCFPGKMSLFTWALVRSYSPDFACVSVLGRCRCLRRLRNGQTYQTFQTWTQTFERLWTPSPSCTLEHLYLNEHCVCEPDGTWKRMFDLQVFHNWTILNHIEPSPFSGEKWTLSEHVRTIQATMSLAPCSKLLWYWPDTGVWRCLEMSGVKARVLVWDWSLDCTTYPGLSGLRLGGHCGWTLTMVRVLHGFTVSHIFLNYTINIRCMYSRGEDMISISLNGGSSYLLYGKSPPSPICTQFGISFWSEASTTQRVHSCCVLLFCINYDSYSYMLYDVIWCYMMLY